MNKKVLAATRRAYGDSQQFPDTIEGNLKQNKAFAARNLNFRAPAPVSVTDAVEIMRVALCVPSTEMEAYNNFKPAHLGMLPECSKVILAREGSVCVYVKLPKDFKTVDARTLRYMMVDECHPQKDGTVRLWWD
jgi:hypothetical protein